MATAEKGLIRKTDASSLASTKSTAALTEISDAIRLHAEIFDLSEHETRHLKKAYFYSEIGNGLVPDCFKGDYRAIFVMSQLAERMGIDLIEALQGCFFVHGRFGWYAEFLVRRTLALGIFTAIDYETAGDIKAGTLTVRAVGTRPDGTKAIGTAVSLAMAKSEGWTRNAKYASMPALMLKKRAATFLIRECAPHILGGASIQTDDEVMEIKGTPGGASVMESNLAAMAALLSEGAQQDVEVQLQDEAAAVVEMLTEE
jgi:hypothetical protein